MLRSRRESHHSNGIAGQKRLQRTSATKSVRSGHCLGRRSKSLSGNWIASLQENDACF